MPSKDLLPRLAMVGSAALLVFLLGFLVARFGWFPATFLDRAVEQGRALLEDEATGNPHLHPVRHRQAGVRAPRPEARVPGVTLVTSLWRAGGDADQATAAARLLAADGSVLHTWHADPREIWERTPHDDAMAGRFFNPFNYIHGSHLFPNGDLLFNCEFLGMVRMDAAGRVVWRLDRRTHHSVHRADDGSFWVCGGAMIDDAEEALRRFPGLFVPLIEDSAVQVEADGSVRREISLLEVLRDSPYWPVVHQSGGSAAARGDVLHTNDVEPLPAALAEQYPLFAAGDLLVSMRDIHAVMVFDPETRAVRWFGDQFWIRQHDPDFIGEGWIAVYDNHSDDFDGRLRGGSRIVAVRPHTGEVRVVHPPQDGGAPFYSHAGGKVQFLDGGNLLITEAQAGRALEVDTQGRPVWQWVKEPEPGGERVAEVMEATRYPYTAEQVRGWSR